MQFFCIISVLGRLAEMLKVNCRECNIHTSVQCMLAEIFTLNCGEKKVTMPFDGRKFVRVSQWIFANAVFTQFLLVVEMIRGPQWIFVYALYA